jgi:hypothetical protein
MARKRDKLLFEPMYKPGSSGTKPAKRKPVWKTILRSILSLMGGQRRIEIETKDKGGGRHAKVRRWFR